MTLAVSFCVRCWECGEELPIQEADCHDFEGKAPLEVRVDPIHQCKAGWVEFHETASA